MDFKPFSFRQSPVLRWMPLGLLLLGAALTTWGCSSETETRPEAAALLSKPVIDQRLAAEDFGFPSQPPSLLNGSNIYFGRKDNQTGKDYKASSCIQCHAVNFWQTPKVQADMAYTTPIDLYLMLTTGKAPEVTHPSPERLAVLPKNHPAMFRDTLSRDERWAVLFYARHLAGAGDIDDKRLGDRTTVASIFGGNCAVCHGKRGFADGPLHTGRASSHELAGGKVHMGLFEPPPANFHDYKRMYNRTDAQIVKILREGIYPSAMPYWAGKKDKDYGFEFDDTILWKLTRYVRQFAYKNDLPDETPPLGPIPTTPVKSSMHGEP